MDKPRNKILAGVNAFPGSKGRTRSSKKQPALSTDSTISLVTPLKAEQPPTNKAQVEPRDTPPTTRAKRRLSATNSSKASELPLKKARLTRQNLALFNNTVELESESSKATLVSQTTWTTSFPHKAQENGISLRIFPVPPSNIEDLRRCFLQPNDLPAKSKGKFQRYMKSIDRAHNKAMVSGAIKQYILKDYMEDEDEDDPTPHYISVENSPFKDFPENVGFNDNLPPPRPDFTEGVWSESFGEFPIQELSGAVPIRGVNGVDIALPHIAGEWECSGGDMDRARIQSAYTGAALVYARNQALECLGKSDPPRHASVITFATDGTLIRFYAHYACTDKGGSLKYYQYLIGMRLFTDSHDEFNLCRQKLQNLRDFAKEQAESLRDQLKQQFMNPPRPNIPRFISFRLGSLALEDLRLESLGLEEPPVDDSTIVEKTLRQKAGPANGTTKGERGRKRKRS
ncbi:hypothetical protein GGR51DRAFT_201524 [Nemania sp. FL0031]|nr:hypothetical protein GGR51DRAFT_201524 [Nemania sp. FL0031]